MMEFLGDGLLQVLNLRIMLVINLGVIIGIIFGAIPGLTGYLGIVIFLPFTFVMEAASGIIFLASIFVGGEFGGSISAILIGTPGTNAAAATMMDGYPLAKKGHGRKALLGALTASTVGGFFSTFALLFFAPMLAAVTINFGPPEYFALAMFGLSIIAGISGKNLFKGLIAGFIGMMVSMVGMDTMTGAMRFTFSNLNLMRGLALLPVLIGVFAVPNIMEKVLARFSGEGDIDHSKLVQLSKEDKLRGKDVAKMVPAMAKASVIGAIVGAIPGAGTGIGSFIAYDVERRTARNAQNFGRGDIRGVAAAESANNAVTAASLIPLLTLGIPGSPAAAALIGAFTMQGMVPGPTLFRDQGPIVYAIMIGILFANLFMFIQGRSLARFFVRVTHVPNQIMVPVLVLMCTAGSYAVNHSVFEMGVFVVFGTFAYILTKLKFPPVPIVLGAVLGPLAEFNLRRSLVMSEGSWSIFLTRPISLAFVIVTAIVLILSLVSGRRIESDKKFEDDV